MSIFELDRRSREWRRLDQVDLRPDPPPHPHAGISSIDHLTAYTTATGEDLIGAGYFANRDSGAPWRVWRHDVQAKRWVWQHEFDFRVQLVHCLAAYGAVLVGLDDGSLHIRYFGRRRDCAVSPFVAGFPR